MRQELLSAWVRALCLQDSYILQQSALVNTAVVRCFTFHCVLSNVIKQDIVLSEKRTYAQKINSNPDSMETGRFLQR